MADSQLARVTALDAYLADRGIIYDGDTDGIITALDDHQLKALLRAVNAVGGRATLDSSGLLHIFPHLTDTGGAS